MATWKQAIEAACKAVHDFGCMSTDSDPCPVVPDLVSAIRSITEPETPECDPPWKSTADELADEVDLLVRRGVIDARSPAADALLDYRNPPSSPRADRILSMEREMEELRKVLRRILPYMGSGFGVLPPDIKEEATRAAGVKP